MRVLVVDDIQELCDLTREYLESVGVSVDVAADGRQALAAIQQRRPDVIVSDLLMPNMDGFELCRAIKSNPVTKNIPIIVCTSNFLDDMDRNFAYSLGIWSYLVRPIELKVLFDEIKQVVNHVDDTALSIETAEFETLHSQVLTNKLYKNKLELDTAQKELQYKHFQFVSLIETLAEPIAEVSANYKFVCANSAFTRWLNIDLSDLHGQCIGELLGDDLLSLVQRLVVDRCYVTTVFDQVIGRCNANEPLDITLEYPNGNKDNARISLVKGDQDQFVVVFLLCSLSVSDDASMTYGVRQVKDLLVGESVIESKKIEFGVIGESEEISGVVTDIGLVGPTDATVLIQGESGTGKELVANAIYSTSNRLGSPFVKVNCGAIAPGLFESELFGHEKGSFTGAIHRRIGRFEQAAGGTLFLDEISELPLDMQVKLLRVLQEGSLERVGGEDPIKINVRLITATNKDLKQCVDEGLFRLDLFYRLNVFPIHVPPLRKRKEDILALANYFLAQCCCSENRHIKKFSSAAIQALKSYPWPGNIRELQNIIERTVIVSRTDIVQLGDLNLPDIAAASIQVGQGDTLLEVETAHIIDVLNRTTWSISGRGGAAEVLGINPSTLRSRMKKYGISRPPVKS